ncbi:MAG: DNA-3-methyladenine glycosylase [Planctomycetota bacterium]
MESSIVTTQPLFRGTTDRVARRLLGKIVAVGSGKQIAAGIIVETEAYLPANDEACHAHSGRTPRNVTMFEGAGKLYVYSIHAGYCMNVVTEQEGNGCAVLIRAIEPVAGIKLMKKRRGKDRLIDLTSGPSKLCQALGVTTKLDGINLLETKSIQIGTSSSIRIRKFDVVVTPRIGISKATELPLRFFVDRNPYVSGLKRLHSGKTDRPLHV